MDRQIIINSCAYETRAAVIEDRRVVEVFIERRRDRGVTGNIYKGRVTRVLPGLQAAFVDIGLAKAAYLHNSDLFGSISDVVAGREEAPFDLANERTADPRTRGKQPPIESRLKNGQEILVQVAKPAIGTKGARVTSVISLPGRHLVYVPSTRHIGVSRRIEDEDERRRLKEIVEAESTEGGFIIRTACEGLTKREIQTDVRFLLRLWRRIRQRSDQASSRTLVHYDVDLVLRITRDLFTSETRRLLVDDAKAYERILDFLDTATPRLRPRVQLYEDSQPIFERFGIDPQIDKALDRKVWLKSGGYVVIDQTEALTVIDVNTGRFVGKRHESDTILKTNLEAVKVIPEQLRLRAIGGLIVVDFIDMDDIANQRKVYDALRDAMRQDKGVARLLPLSELGLIEMTRKRTRASLGEILCAPCPTCGATSRTKSPITVAYEILRRLKREAVANAPAAGLYVDANPAVVEHLRRYEGEHLRSLESAVGKPITVRANSDCATTEYMVSVDGAPEA